MLDNSADHYCPAYGKVFSAEARDFLKDTKAIVPFV